MSAGYLHKSILSPEAGEALIILWHVMGGIYFWEFFTTLDYEWKVIRGHLPHRYTIWIYSLTRVACLLGVILCTYGLDNRNSIDCQVWVSFMTAFFCTSMASASLLIVLRIIAIWSKHKAVMAMSIIIWGAGVAFHINSGVRLRYSWSPEIHNCLSISSESSVLGLVPTIFADLLLILIMLVGLLLLRRNGGGTFGLTPLLLKQGVIWLVLAIVSGAPPAIVAAVSTNDELTDMILSPGLVTMTIAATRMHRSLVDYASGLPDVVSAQGNRRGMSNGLFSNTKRALSASDSPGRIEVTVRTDFEQHTPPQTNDYAL